MNWKIEYIYLKYRDYIINDQAKFDIKRRYNLSGDDYAILSNKIKKYQIDRYGDILYYTGYEFYTKEELEKIRDRAFKRKRARLNRKK